MAILEYEISRDVIINISKLMLSNIDPVTNGMGEFRTKSHGSDHKLARVSFHGAGGVVGRGKGYFERYDFIRLNNSPFSSVSWVSIL